MIELDIVILFKILLPYTDLEIRKKIRLLTKRLKMMIDPIIKIRLCGSNSSICSNGSVVEGKYFRKISNDFYYVEKNHICKCSANVSKNAGSNYAYPNQLQYHYYKLNKLKDINIILKKDLATCYELEKVASIKGNCEALNILFNNFNKGNRCVKKTWDLLLLACNHDRLNIVKFLWKKICNNDNNIKFQYSDAFLTAITHGGLSVVKYFLGKGYDIYEAIRHELKRPIKMIKNAIIDSSLYGNVETTEIFLNLIRNKVQICKYDFIAAFSNACHYNNLVMVNFFWDQGNLTTEDIKSEVSEICHKAIENNHQDVVLFFINKGISPEDLKYNNDTSILSRACIFARLNLIKMLWNYCGGVETIRNDKCNTVLHAVIKGHYDVLKFLWSKGITKDDLKSVNFSSYYWSYTPLGWACINGHVKVVKFLLEKGIEYRQSSGNIEWSVFHVFERAHMEIIELFFKHGLTLEEFRDHGLSHLKKINKKDAKVVNFLNKYGLEV